MYLYVSSKFRGENVAHLCVNVLLDPHFLFLRMYHVLQLLLVIDYTYD